MKKTIAMCASLALFGIMGVATSLLSPPIGVAEAAATRPLLGSETKDFASIADGAGASEDVSVFGASLGDFCMASLGVDVVDVVVDCAVTATDVATVRLQNESTAAADLASTTLRVQVYKRESTGG